jgi:hypothetical protein
MDFGELIKQHGADLKEAATGLAEGNREMVFGALEAIILRIAKGHPEIGLLAPFFEAGARRAFALSATQRLEKAMAAARTEGEKATLVSQIAESVELLLGQSVISLFQMVRVQYPTDEIIEALGGMRKELADFRDDFQKRLEDEGVRVNVRRIREGGTRIRISEGAKARLWGWEMNVKSEGNVQIDSLKLRDGATGVRFSEEAKASIVVREMNVNSAGSVGIDVRKDEFKEKKERASLERERPTVELDANHYAQAERRENEVMKTLRLEAERKVLEKAKAEQEVRELSLAERSRLEVERSERQRLEAERSERQRLEAERSARQRLEAERSERQRLEAERSERQRLEAERSARQRLEAERSARERLEVERRARLEAESARQQERMLLERNVTHLGKIVNHGWSLGSLASPSPSPAPTPLNVVLAHPRRLAKGHSARFLVQVYPRLIEKLANKMRRGGFSGADTSTTTAESKELRQGMTVEILLTSQSIDFDQAGVKKKIGEDVTAVWFEGKPIESVAPGIHQGILRIRETTEQVEIVSLPFSVKICDFAFDHVSRPAFAKVVACTTGLGSIAIWLLTAMGHVDKAFGLSSGTAALAVAAFVLRRLTTTYKRPEVASSATFPS